MKIIEWSVEKNRRLKSERGISFEDVIFSIANDGLIDIIIHPNKTKYPDQKIFIVKMDNYAYLVPFTEKSNIIYLKTIIPSRKATKLYIED